MSLREPRSVRVVREVRVEQYGIDMSTEEFERLEARHWSGGAVALMRRDRGGRDEVLWWVADHFYRDSDGSTADRIERIDGTLQKVTEVALSLKNPERTAPRLFSEAKVRLSVARSGTSETVTIPGSRWDGALRGVRPTCVAQTRLGNVWATAAELPGAEREYESRIGDLWGSRFQVVLADTDVTQDDLLALRQAPIPEPAAITKQDHVDIWADDECIAVPVERFVEIDQCTDSSPLEVGRSGSGTLWRVGKNYYWDTNSDLSAEEVDLTLWDTRRRRDSRFERLRKIRAREEDIELYRRERIPDEVRAAVWERDEGRCVQCGTSEDLQFDHIIPVSKGGNASIDNIQILCGNCNREKGSSII